jgi:hypothetical protein
MAWMRRGRGEGLSVRVVLVVLFSIVMSSVNNYDKVLL